MRQKRTKSGNISLPPGSDLPPDENVTLPSQVRHAAAIANALATGRPAPAKPKPETRPGFPHTNAEIDQALQRLKKGALQVSEPEFNVIRDLAKEGARHIKSRRRGAQDPRETSESVKRRQEALLQSYRELSPNLQKHRTGTTTLGALRKAVIKKLGLTDDDNVISEDTLKKDIQELRPIFKLVREGKIPAPGPKPVKQKFSGETQKEMIAGKRTLKQRP
jgi:hypothetical protein